MEATCRAYINFTNADDVFLFKERFDGYVFVDAAGTEYPAQVEYAPFQGFSKSRSKKKDIKASSIETDVHYLEFVERFNNQEIAKSDLKADFNLNAKSTDSEKLTPLLEYLQDKKDARREDRKRRNDERKDRRDKDRQQKKILVAKNIPPSIKEEGAGPSEQKEKTDSKDGASRNSQEDKPRESNMRRDRYEEKRTQRKREKDAKRRERRDQKRAEERRGSKESIESGIVKKIDDLNLNEADDGENDEEPKEMEGETKKPVEQIEKKPEKREPKDDRRNERRERDRREERERRIRNKVSFLCLCKGLSLYIYTS